MWENARLGPEAFDLSKRRALVVGAASGVGRAIALALSEAGADVTATSATPSASEALAVKRLAQQIATTGPRREPHSLDASLGTAVQVMVRQVVKDVGGIDILVTAPDLFLGKPAEKTSDLEWSRIVNANLSSVFFACRAAGREMVKQGWGRIINVASALGERGLANGAAYCAAKARRHEPDAGPGAGVGSARRHRQLHRPRLAGGLARSGRAGPSGQPARPLHSHAPARQRR